MNHGRLGYIDNYRLRLAPTILEQFGLRRGNVLFGVYYPRQHLGDDRRNATVDDDFMLTPLYPRLWDRAACFVIRIKHEPGAFAKIAKFIAEQNVSIYCSEFSRSAYRYATWNIHAVVTDLPKRLKYNRRLSGYTETINRFKQIKVSILKECGDVLFVDPREPDLEQPVKLLHLSALSYFAHYCKNAPKSRPQLKPFRFRVAQDGYLIDEQGGFKEVIDRIQRHHRRDLRHSVFFVEADRRNFNMRLAVFSGSQNDSIFVARACYSSNGEWDQFKGLLARVSENLPESCNIWKCGTEKLEISDDSEKGVIKMVIEDSDTHVHAAEKMRRIKDALVKQSNIFAPQTRIVDPRVQPASREYCAVRIDADYAPEAKERPHVFISYHPKAQRVQAEQLRAQFKEFGIYAWLAGNEVLRDNWYHEVRGALCQAKELMLLWSPSCSKSEWVMTEWILALEMNIPITVFLVSGGKTGIPERLSGKQVVFFKDIEARRQTVARIAYEINAKVD